MGAIRRHRLHSQACMCHPRTQKPVLAEVLFSTREQIIRQKFALALPRRLLASGRTTFGVLNDTTAGYHSLLRF